MGATRVVVGYDGSAHADLAVEWAAVEAVRRGVRLTVLTAARVPASDVEASVDAGRTARAWADMISGKGADAARRAAPDVDAVGESHLGHAAEALVAASGDAALVVVGARGRGSFSGALLGSVASELAARAACPVVVVRRATSLSTGMDHPVVVGVDGSPAAMAALDFAADLASGWAAPLSVLVAWHLEAVDAWALTYASSAGQVTDLAAEAEQSAHDVAQRAAARARDRHPRLVVTTRVVAAAPAQALVHASHGARLVVVGARGRGRLSSLVLGSVSHATTHGAACPVAVVRADHAEPGRRPGTDQTRLAED